jgi:lipoprotein-releasing system ATP-binding protein
MTVSIPRNLLEVIMKINYPLLAMTSVSKSWPSPGNSDEEVVILDSISLDINPGDTLAVQGPSGSGKSTMLNILSSLDIPVSGAVLYNNENILEWSAKRVEQYRNRDIGILFQEHHLLPQCTVLENVLLPAVMVKDRTSQDALTEKARELLSLVQMDHRLHHSPATLSMGECQRTAMVRALINDPAIIFADEPTGSLDMKNSTRLLDLLFSIAEKGKKTVILVTHSDYVAGHCSKRYHLESGALTRK